jgi:phosphinothricin acetyltransferase
VEGPVPFLREDTGNGDESERDNVDHLTSFEKARPADFRAIAEIDRNAWKHSRNGEFIPDGEHVWRLWIEHALVFVARQAEDVTGAVIAFPCISGVFCAHKVFVHESSRHAGIGTRLFEVLLDELDKLQVDCFLTVDPVNEALINLYTRLGFTEKQFIEGFYRSDEDRYVLTRRFGTHGQKG